MTAPEDDILVIRTKDGVDLLTIRTDGTVDGSIEDAGEAARIFVTELRRLAAGGAQ